MRPVRSSCGCGHNKNQQKTELEEEDDEGSGPHYKYSIQYKSVLLFIQYIMFSDEIIQSFIE